ncbi:UDP-GlcNAc--UDP-phosphate GlcNAc-1-phosphate transferase [Pedobacter sp. HMF7647]|uniref:UDP-GlcNAc--UDP-phosphate GlcNAc-1-phosphate transferase n=1 Tax=Hufsiella arboris TaxID=2695275 RepID=A0A7K1YAV4_9SPHI|nr:glycosyltransferase family 4 protein [Hufsiella arboris]MXV51714.1 UDP-GlcNAc--UDP-phosphate GlcNAc-1-phosphate transferase [Hufsiella arboris]
MIYGIYLILFFILELAYFRIADRYNIIDKPNHRSSHTKLTIRGGGIIFPLAIILWFGISGFSYPYFALGLFLVSLVSFIDDFKELKPGIRTFIQFASVSLMLMQLPLSLAWYWYLPILVLVIATINAYNFMDGINGITGGYSLIALLSLLYINHYVAEFTDYQLIVLVILSVLVFNFFNFRRKAKCFAGDVGSVSVAFIIIFFTLQLITKTGNFLYILLLLVYGLDAVTTVLFRLSRNEKITEAHRSHFYQFLANSKRWPHLLVAALYSVMQLLVNCMVISLSLSNSNNIWLTVSVTVLSGIAFILIRITLEGKQILQKEVIKVK